MNRRTTAGIAGCVGLAIVIALGPAIGWLRAEDRPRLEVAYSKNVELICILANLTSSWDPKRPSFPFALEARKRFLPFKDLEAVASAGDLLQKRSLNYLVRMALYFTEVPEAKLIQPNLSIIHKFFISRSIPDIRDFYRKSAFEAFWTENKPLYERWKTELESKIAGLPLAALLEEYFGTKKESYTLVFTPQAPNLRTWDVNGPRGQDAVVVFGPSDEGSDGRSFVPARLLVTDIILRMFGHIWLIETLDKHPELVAKYAHLQDSAQKGLTASERQRPWRFVILENVRAAVVARLTEKLYGPAAAAEVLERSRKQGSLVAPRLVQFCREYEANRKKYPTFESFLPELLSRWERQIKSE